MGVSQSSEANSLDQPLTALQGVGAERSALLARLGLSTIRDLLMHRPRRYEDRRNFCPIARLQAGSQVLTCGKVVAMGTKWFARHTRSVFELVLDDGTGRLHCRWWNLNYMENYFKVGDEVVVCGKLGGIKPRTMDHPDTEVTDRGPEESTHMGRIVPVYPLTENLSQRWLRGLIWRTLQQYEPPDGIEGSADIAAALDLPAGNSQEGTSALWTAFRTLPYASAVRLMHLPETLEDPERARSRLALEELLVFQLRLQRRRRNFESKSRGLPCGGTNRLVKPLLKNLGFTLTDAQTRVLREIRAEMGGPHPMRRLLQGDVGSGKTLVAFCTALMALESGYSAALMAPTEILAEQHFRTALKWLAPLGVPVHIVTGTRKTYPPATDNADTCALYIGTHALIEPEFAPHRLGLVIIDEQHKFGVAQRDELLRKGHFPHLLVMTATPIPRTLGLTLYGDLDSSILDEMPPGRGRIRTFIRSETALSKVWQFVKSQLAAGRQSYIVYPRIEETTGNVKAVTIEFEKVSAALTPHAVAMLHGRLPQAESDRIMKDFSQGRAHALLATSLVEVGVDVQNATVMVIENAEQFGLAQLHQLRGRIGRGAHESYCILVRGAKADASAERLAIMEKTSDGFEIAEADLAIRGPGDFLGKDQSGVPDFKFADLTRDLDLLRLARQAALAVLQQPVSARQSGAAGS